MRQAKRRKTGLRWDKNGTGTGREREAIGHSNGTRSAGSTTSRGRANAVAVEAVAAEADSPRAGEPGGGHGGDRGAPGRPHGEPLLASAPYHEVAPYLVLMAGW